MIQACSKSKCDFRKISEIESTLNYSHNVVRIILLDYHLNLVKMVMAS